MKIGIDASRLALEQKTGVEVYSREIISRLVERANSQKTHQIRLYSPSRIDEIKDSEQVIQRIIPFPRLWTHARLSFELMLHPVDVLFVPSHVLPLHCPKNSVITIHDVAFRHFRKAYSRMQYHYLNWSTRFACKNASKIIVPSKATAQDLEDFYKCPRKKIIVIPHGPPHASGISCEHTVRARSEANNLALPVVSRSEHIIKEFFEQFQLNEKDKFILFIGRLETKKNLIRLVAAFSEFVTHFPDWKLVLAGKRGVGIKKIVKEIDEHKLWDRVILPGYIEEAEKAWLFEKCQFFAFPSLYEGFGLPILEAFQNEVPVLTSDTSSLSEVAGHAAEFVNPNRTSSILNAMEKLAQNMELREKLVRDGKKQIRQFSWQNSADETWKTLTTL